MATLPVSVGVLNGGEALPGDGYIPTPADLAELNAWCAEFNPPPSDAEIDAMYERHLAEQDAERALAEDETQSVADGVFRGQPTVYIVSAA